MAMMNLELGEPIEGKHMSEFRFTPHPQILNRGGDLVAAFHGGPFDQWRVSSTPFRVEIFNQMRSKVAFAGFRNIGMDMEAVDLFSLFNDNTRKWLRAATMDSLLGDLPVNWAGFRVRIFTPVNASDDDFLDGYRRQFLGIFDGMLEIVPNYKLHDNTILLNLSERDKNITISMGPLKKEDAKSSNWVDTDDGIAIVPQFSLAADIDINQRFPQANLMKINELMRFISESRELAVSINERLLDVLRGRND